MCKEISTMKVVGSLTGRGRVQWEHKGEKLQVRISMARSYRLNQEVLRKKLFTMAEAELYPVDNGGPLKGFRQENMIQLIFRKDSSICWVVKGFGRSKGDQ